MAGADSIIVHPPAITPANAKEIIQDFFMRFHSPEGPFGGHSALAHHHPYTPIATGVTPPAPKAHYCALRPEWTKPVAHNASTAPLSSHG
jgi:hypothetical protein